MSLFEWQNLVVGYHTKHPLTYPFSGAVSKAGIYAITGQNGCGKSTLLKTWLGLQDPLAGGVYLHGAPLNPKKLKGVAYVPQFHSVNRFFHISVANFVKQGFGPHHVSTPSDDAQVDALLQQWQLGDYRNRSFHLLSGGQKVRCLVARALISKPQILFLDEPLASLDNCCRKQLMDTLKQLVETQSVCVFMIDHHFDNYANYIESRIDFQREHDNETATVSFFRQPF